MRLIDEIIKEEVTKSTTWHMLTDLDIENKTAICSLCGRVQIISKGYDKTGTIKRWQCRERNLKRSKKTNERIRDEKRGQKTECERCGFVVEDSCQLDIHHKDGNHENNNKNNLEILCANCHRYVTWVIGER